MSTARDCEPTPGPGLPDLDLLLPPRRPFSSGPHPANHRRRDLACPYSKALLDHSLQYPLLPVPSQPMRLVPKFPPKAISTLSTIRKKESKPASQPASLWRRAPPPPLPPSLRAGQGKSPPALPLNRKVYQLSTLHGQSTSHPTPKLGNPRPGRGPSTQQLASSQTPSPIRRLTQARTPSRRALHPSPLDVLFVPTITS
jgi:hypothetical protein